MYINLKKLFEDKSHKANNDDDNPTLYQSAKSNLHKLSATIKRLFYNTLAKSIPISLQN